MQPPMVARGWPGTTGSSQPRAECEAGDVADAGAGLDGQQALLGIELDQAIERAEILDHAILAEAGADVGDAGSRA